MHTKADSILQTVNAKQLVLASCSANCGRQFPDSMARTASGVLHARTSSGEQEGLLSVTLTDAFGHRTGHSSGTADLVNIAHPLASC